ncbi:MAG: aromatic aminobenezylarsenical efflux permease ArsG family transporter [Prevotellaceae bacterium]|jgi:cytochrome c biogenesis protein CcdA|nr:aromatic aminobenezylarsenical efflux permease ArsG family transporter [Prevotellaceae bacterium]
MEELLHIIETKEFPLLSALFLGIMVAVAPCTIAANITVIGFLAGEEQNRKKVFINGIAYTLGRTVAYGLLGTVIFYFAGGLRISELLQHSFGKIIGPLFILVGFLMLDIIHMHGLTDKCLHRLNFKKRQKRNRNAFGLGLLLAFAFCPYCAAIYFGMLIPFSFTVSHGAALSWVFGIGAAIPVFIMIGVIAFSYTKLYEFYNKLQKFEVWFRRILGILFILSGILFVVEYYLE